MNLRDSGKALQDGFAANLRRLRRRRGLSLERLAQLSSVSRSAISDLERARKAPTVNVAARLAAALKVTFATLVEGAAARVAILRGADALPLAERTCRRVPLIPDGVEGAAPFFRIELPGQASHVGTPHGAGTIEHVLVGGGEVVVECGDDLFHLEDGDAIVFDGDQPHAYVNATDQAATLYVVVSRPA